MLVQGHADTANAVRPWAHPDGASWNTTHMRHLHARSLVDYFFTLGNKPGGSLYFTRPAYLLLVDSPSWLLIDPWPGH